MPADWSLPLILLALILLANALPALLDLVLGPARPLDLGLTLGDGRPLLGPHKTWRGLVACLLGGALGALALGLTWGLGLLVGLGAALGDLLASFAKRRLGLTSGTSVPLLDQIPEALIPALLAKAELGLGWVDLALVVGAFVILDLVLTPLGRRLRGVRASSF